MKSKSNELTHIQFELTAESIGSKDTHVTRMQINCESLSHKHREAETLANYSRRKNSEEIYTYHRSRTVDVKWSGV